MNYIELINRLWQSHEVNQLNTTEIALYFYLVKIFNSCHWADSVKRLNVKINADLNITYPTMCKARNRLKQIGLIDFKTKNGNSNTEYTLKKFLKVCNEVTNEVCNEVTNEVCDEINKTETETKQNKKDAYASKEAVDALSLISEIMDLPDGCSGPHLERGNPEPYKPQEPPAGKEKKVPPKKESDTANEKAFCDKVREYYNTHCITLNPVKVLTDARKSSILARFREHGSENIFLMLDNVSHSSFLAGQNKRGWKADFDWIVRPTNFVKILEGNYNDKKNETNDNKQDKQRQRDYSENIF